MSKLTSKKVLAATVAGLAVAGGGAAIATSQPDSRASSFLDSVAEHLGISSQELEDATKAAAIDQVDQALADGRITEEQAEALKERIESGDVEGLFGPGLFGPGLFELRQGGPGEDSPGRGEHHFFPFGGKLSGAAEFLGLSEAELREQLSEGKSLAEIAEAAGKSLEGLKEAILGTARAALDEAVERDLLTQEQADSIYERLQGWIDDLVNGNFAGPGRLGIHPGFGGPPGFTPRGGDDDNGGSSGSAYWDTAA